jgi:(S)-ureidoglycine aminohydrolase
MEISALTRTVVNRTHALISTDGYVNSVVPGWTGCTVHVLISREMGARFTQTLATLQKDGLLSGATKDTQLFFYVLQGRCRAAAGNEASDLENGHFLYVPPGKDYVLESREEGTQLLTFRKVYEKLEEQPPPPLIFGDAASVKGTPFLGDEALRLQVLLPDNLSFDMAVNIFTYDPGGHLPFVETHVMEHGLTFLQGQGIYLLDQQWYPVKKGDSIWMAPYCPQWFTAMGKEPAVYIYYKNVNRL